MKKKVVMESSKPNKDGVIALAEAGSKRVNISASSKIEDFRSRFLGNLTAKKQEVEETLKRLTDNQKEYEGLLFARDSMESVDQAEREISAQTHYRFLERKNKELKKIETLICRILEEEEFGRCEECGKRIPEERLLIVPEATRCVRCQREMEKWDSRRTSVEISYFSSRTKKESHWGQSEDFDDEENLSLKPDMEYTSFMDLAETDLGEPGKEKEGK